MVATLRLDWWIIVRRTPLKLIFPFFFAFTSFAHEGFFLHLPCQIRALRDYVLDTFFDPLEIDMIFDLTVPSERLVSQPVR